MLFVTKGGIFSSLQWRLFAFLLFKNTLYSLVGFFCSKSTDSTLLWHWKVGNGLEVVTKKRFHQSITRGLVGVVIRNRMRPLIGVALSNGIIMRLF